jgi:hypothetical protein
LRKFTVVLLGDPTGVELKLVEKIHNAIIISKER